MPLDLEEQEKVAELKAWWDRYGNIVIAIALGAAIAFSAWAWWRNHQAGQAAQASALYEQLSRSAQSNDAKTMREAGGALIESYGGTLYASMGALVSAHYYFEHKDLKSAKAQLQWVLDHSDSDDFRDLARLRMAGVLLDEKAYDEALKTADAPHGAAYEAQFAAMKGDILVAKGQPADAKAAYKLALEKSAGKNDAFRQAVQLRLEALGA